MPPTFLADTPTNSDLEGKLNCKMNSYKNEIFISGILTLASWHCDQAVSVLIAGE